MSGIAKARKTAEGLKEKTKKKGKATAVAVEKAEKGLAAIVQDPELAKMYKDNATLGAENLAGASPILKVHSTGKSITNELANGEEPNNGWFFYKPTEEQFETVECHVLCISKGFRSEGMRNENKLGKDQFNQILGGVIVNSDNPKPFIMYLSGKKLQRMWDFGKEASKYTRAKPIPIPMFALKVKLSTEQEKSAFGPQWVINFEIVKGEDNSLVVVTDSGLFAFLKDMVSSVKESVDSLVAARTKEQEPVVEEVSQLDEELGLT